MLPFYEIRKDELSVIRNLKEISFPPHMHGYLEILYIISGSQRIEVNDQTYDLYEGDAAMIFPDMVHHYETTGHSSTSEVLIIVHPKLLGGLFPDLTRFHPKNPIITKPYIHEDVAVAFEKVKRDDDYAIKLGWTHIIIAHLIREIEFEQVQQLPVQDLSKKLMEYLATHFTEPITLDTLASEFNVSKYYISRIFSKRFKMNLRNYLSMLRVEYASMLIRTTDASLTTVWMNAGFDSQRTFNRVFQAIYGMTPRDFKNNVSNYLK
ncbi:AraC family transcriptional regulator [Paenibacillus sp. FSL K6-0108]|uniref:helix-turn-helix transcriptional regulator n=1 Tax=Paenibacillus sp. FSL K6-0108 TaxID=2921417 RepID=UPI003244D21B